MQTVQAIEGQQRKPQPVLDDETLLTSAQVRARVGGVSTMCVWRWQRDPKVQFPAPLKMNSRNYWRMGDLRDWQSGVGHRGFNDNCTTVERNFAATPLLRAASATYGVTRVEYGNGSVWPPGT